MNELIGDRRDFRNGDWSLSFTDSGAVIFEGTEYPINLDTVFSHPDLLNLHGGLGLERTDTELIVQELLRVSGGPEFDDETKVLCKLDL